MPNTLDDFIAAYQSKIPAIANDIKTVTGTINEFDMRALMQRAWDKDIASDMILPDVKGRHTQMQQLQTQVAQVQAGVSSLSQQAQELIQLGQNDARLTSRLQKLNQLSQSVNQLLNVINNYSNQLQEYISCQYVANCSQTEIIKAELIEGYGLSAGQAGALFFQPHLEFEEFDKEAKRMANENQSLVVNKY